MTSTGDKQAEASLPTTVDPMAWLYEVLGEAPGSCNNRALDWATVQPAASSSAALGQAAPLMAPLVPGIHDMELSAMADMLSGVLGSKNEATAPACLLKTTIRWSTDDNGSNPMVQQQQEQNQQQQQHHVADWDNCRCSCNPQRFANADCLRRHLRRALSTKVYAVRSDEKEKESSASS